jgi:Protein of unknown function (DUF3604)
MNFPPRLLLLFLLAASARCASSVEPTFPEEPDSTSVARGFELGVSQQQVISLADALFDFDPTIDPRKSATDNAGAIAAHARDQLPCATVQQTDTSVSVSAAPPGCLLGQGAVFTGNVVASLANTAGEVRVTLTLTEVALAGSAVAGPVELVTADGSTFDVNFQLTRNGTPETGAMTATGTSNRITTSGTVSSDGLSATLTNVSIQKGDCYPNGGTLQISRGRATATATFDAQTAQSGVASLGRGRTAQLPAYGSCPATGATSSSAAAGSCADYNVAKNVYFGDLHNHTSYSLDAFAVGTTGDPAKSYLFAKKAPNASVNIAEGIPGTPANPLAPARRLDFLAVTDHSEWFDLMGLCSVDTSSPYYSDPYCVTLRTLGSQQQALLVAAAGARALSPNPRSFALCASSPTACDAAASDLWLRTKQAAMLANAPCSFTSFNAYEWTGTTATANLHRNVIFANDVTPSAALDYVRYPSAHDLWTGLSQQCTGACDVLTIPHNSNLSLGAMFSYNSEDVPFMQRYQTLAEIFQHKGASECLTLPTPPPGTANDPECGFEHATVSLLTTVLDAVGGGNVNYTPDERTRLEYPSYLRPALERGLTAYAATRVNPLQMGFVAATDNHNSSPGYVVEDAWKGHLGVTDDQAQERLSDANNSFNPGGLTAVWAEQNSREAMFAAFKRREVYATSGTRLAVRFYEYDDVLYDPCRDASFPSGATRRGAVPMGGSFSAATRGSPPRFVIQAAKDQVNLSEIQIVKASSDAAGNVKETIVRFPQAAGGVPTACQTWVDPAFVPSVPAFYYARVFETPVKRWSAYDCAAVDPSTLDAGTRARCSETDPEKGGLNITIRERAWTSPIWFTP